MRKSNLFSMMALALASLQANESGHGFTRLVSPQFPKLKNARDTSRPRNPRAGDKLARLAQRGRVGVWSAR